MKYLEIEHVKKALHVTPLAGVWIEIPLRIRDRLHSRVTPLAGVWIEIRIEFDTTFVNHVTPLAGVWIEIEISKHSYTGYGSHSPCGSVD